MTEMMGRLERVDLRDAWESEAGHFTPWLAREDNLALLGETTGIDLELEAQEQHVGPFRADLLCKDTVSGHWVLIENQLERTDHVHLGQLLTYAAGLKAATIVWIADRFHDEHRAALDWLNEITDDRFNFFGLEVELWRIGTSPVAPKFNIVCQPNDWTRTVAREAARAESGELSGAKQRQVEFWSAFREAVLDSADAVIKPTKPLPQHWMNIAIGRTGFRLAAVASLYDSVNETFDSHEIRAELSIEPLESKTYFSMLESEKATIEQEIGDHLTWHNPENKRQCRIYLRRGADLHDRNRWPEYHRWLLEKLNRFHEVFAPRIRRLDPAEWNGDLTSD